MTIFAIAFAMIAAIHKQKQLKGKVERENLRLNFEKEILTARLDEQEQAMQLISEEIHDNTGQVLGLIHRYLQKATIETVDNVLVLGHLEKATQLLDKAIVEIRHISHGLNSELVREKGLSTSIEREVHYLEETAKFRSSFELTGTPIDLWKGQNLLIFRIVQEALQNAAKHSHATLLSVIMHYTNDQLELRIKDNGIGFDAEDQLSTQSLGLRNIMNRANVLQGSIKISSVPGSGTEIFLTVPINSQSL